MPMKLRWWHDQETHDLIFEGRVSMSAFIKLDLDQIDREMLRMPAEKASHFLLSIQMLFRRAEEQAEAKKEAQQRLLSQEIANAEA